MIKIYSQEEIQKIRQAGHILAKVLKALKNETKPGTSLSYLDNLAKKITKEFGAEPAFLGYKPEGAKHAYAYSICTSLNNVIVHGTPREYCLIEGDVLKIDFGVKYPSTSSGQASYYSDSAVTVIVGRGTKEAQNLLKATQNALEQAIKIAKPGNYLGDIGWAIERTAKKFDVKVIKGLTGHGIGLDLHEEPVVYNYGKKGAGFELKPGMVFAVEPMFSIGTEDIIQLGDESWATIDGSLSAQFEHTIAITSKGAEILTR